MSEHPTTGSTSSLAIQDPVLEAFAQEVGSEGPVAVAGGRTRWDLGGSLAADVRIVSAPSGVVDYIPEEMIVTVRAGTAVAELEAVLAEAGQRCALPNRGGTVGGALAVGENDLTMLGRGRIRDCLLQVRYVSAEGELVTGGGPTVKNVTGFDLPRLMVGSLGRLGCLAEVVLRTNPQPTTSRWLHSSDADPFTALDAVLRPSAVLWNGSDTWILLEGHSVDVDSQTEALVVAGTFNPSDGPPELPPHRWSLAPARLRSLGHGSDNADLGRFVAAVGTGLVLAERPQPARPLSPALQEVSDRIKHHFDPTGRLNPRLPS